MDRLVELFQNEEFLKQTRLVHLIGCPTCKSNPKSKCNVLRNAISAGELIKLQENGKVQCSSCKETAYLPKGNDFEDFPRFFSLDEPNSCVTASSLTISCLCLACESMFDACGRNKLAFNLYRKAIFKSASDNPGVFYTSSLHDSKNGEWKIKIKSGSGALGEKRIREQWRRQRGLVTYPIPALQAQDAKSTIIPANSTFEQFHNFGTGGVSEENGFVLTAKGKKLLESNQEPGSERKAVVKRRKVNPLEGHMEPEPCFDQIPSQYTIFAIAIDPRIDAKNSLSSMHCRPIDASKPEAGYTITTKLLSTIEERMGTSKFFKWARARLRKTLSPPKQSEPIVLSDDELSGISDILERLGECETRIQQEKEAKSQLNKEMGVMIQSLQSRIGLAIEIHDVSLMRQLSDREFQIKVKAGSKRKPPLTAKNVSAVIPSVLGQFGIDLGDRKGQEFVDAIQECLERENESLASNSSRSQRQFSIGPKSKPRGKSRVMEKNIDDDDDDGE